MRLLLINLPKDKALKHFPPIEFDAVGFQKFLLSRELEEVLRVINTALARGCESMHAKLAASTVIGRMAGDDGILGILSGRFWVAYELSDGRTIAYREPYDKRELLTEEAAAASVPEELKPTYDKLLDYCRQLRAIRERNRAIQRDIGYVILSRGAEVPEDFDRYYRKMHPYDRSSTYLKGNCMSLDQSFNPELPLRELHRSEVVAWCRDSRCEIQVRAKDFCDALDRSNESDSSLRELLRNNSNLMQASGDIAISLSNWTTGADAYRNYIFTYWSVSSLEAGLSPINKERQTIETDNKFKLQ